MTKALSTTDFRAVRHILEPHDFALGGDEEDPLPTDQIELEVWHGIMDLPDDVAIRTSDHHGKHLELLQSLWGDWIVAVGNPRRKHDELFGCMLDANDCLQCATFELLHGFCRAAIANLRTALELVMIGALGNCQPTHPKYQRWQRSDVENFGFSYCRGQFLEQHRGGSLEWLFEKKSGFPALLYAELCNYTHARPDSTDSELWESNGPVYSGRAFFKSFKLCLDVYATCYLLVKIGRPAFRLPKNSKILFELDWMTRHAELAQAYGQLYLGKPKK